MFGKIGKRFTEITETTFRDKAGVTKMEQTVNEYGESISEEVEVWQDMPCAIVWGSGSLNQDGLTYAQSQEGVLMYPKNIHLEAGWLMRILRKNSDWCVIGGVEKTFLTHNEREICRVKRV